MSIAALLSFQLATEVFQGQIKLPAVIQNTSHFMVFAPRKTKYKSHSHVESRMHFAVTTFHAMRESPRRTA